MIKTYLIIKFIHQSGCIYLINDHLNDFIDWLQFLLFDRFSFSSFQRGTLPKMESSSILHSKEVDSSEAPTSFPWPSRLTPSQHEHVYDTDWTPKKNVFLTSRCSLVNICSTFVWHIGIYIRLVSAISYYWTSIRTFRRNFYYLYVSASSCLILRLLKHDLLELELKLGVSRI